MVPITDSADCLKAFASVPLGEGVVEAVQGSIAAPKAVVEIGQQHHYAHDGHGGGGKRQNSGRW